MTSERLQQRRDFVSGALSNVVREAKGKGWRCDYYRDEEIADAFPDRKDTFFGDEVVIATAPNGYPYFIDVSCDSMMTMVYDVVRVLQYK